MSVTPYYEDEYSTLYLGDSLGVLAQLPDDQFDAVVTDPPYSSGGMVRSDRTNKKPSQKYEQTTNLTKAANFFGDNRDQRSWHYWTALWLSECLRLTKPEGRVLTFADWRQLPTLTDALQAGGWVWRGLVAWDKGPTARAPHTNYFRHQAEYVAWGSNGVLRPREPGTGGCWPGVITEPVKRADKHHMTGKPTMLMRKLLLCVPDGGSVLDPFAGSGSTLLAAKSLGLRSVGIEINLHHCEVAARRLRGVEVAPGMAEQLQLGEAS